MQSYTQADTFNSGTTEGEEDVEYEPGEDIKGEQEGFDNICPSDNLILFAGERPYVKNSAGTDILPQYLQQTPNWSGGG